MIRKYICSICGKVYDNRYDCEDCEDTCKRKQKTELVYVCPNCYYVGNNWRYANPYNSTHFCVECGCAMNEQKLTQSEIECYNDSHRILDKGAIK